MKISDYCNNLYTKIDKEPSFKYEKIVFFLFSFFVIFISCCHEPWFDEFQAWGVSKDNLYNILFVAPHYEGHPPLWHLIIKCFSEFNINAELCIKIPNIIIMMLGTGLLIFKSPFPRIIRLFLPFTYFIFYQYSIISRPYSIFYLGIVLCAVFFKTKKTNPFRYICFLVLTSLSSAYGLAISSGITLAWGLELLDYKKLKQSFKSLFKNKQFHAMLLLFIFSFMLSLEIFPSQQNTAISVLKFLPLWQKFIYITFGLISDSLIYNIVTEFVLPINFFKGFYNLYAISGFCFGLFINIFIIEIFKKAKILQYFLIPYLLLLTLFSVYYVPHHVGLIFIIIVFCFWISYDNLFSVLSQKELNILKILTAIIIIVQIYWGILSGIADIFYSYDCSRQIASYIKKHELYNYRIFSGGWIAHYYIDENGSPIFNKYLVKMIDKKNDGKYIKINYDINNMYVAVVALPYFDKNIFYNFNIDSSDKRYVLHKNRTNEDQLIMQKWRNKGKPEVIIGNAPIEIVWQDIKLDDYILVNNVYNYNIWKNDILKRTSPTPIYIHKDLFKKLNFANYIFERIN